MKKNILSKYSLSLVLLIILTGLFSIVPSCSGGGGGSGGGGTPSFTELTSRSWSLPAATEAYKCKGIQAATDLYITGFRAVLPPGQFRMFVTTSDTAQTIGDYDCNAATALLNTRLIYAAGMGTDDVLFPSGIGVHVKSGQYITLQLHVVNGQNSPLSGVSGVMVKMASAAEVTTEADMTLVGTLTFNLPSDGQVHTATGGCTAPEAWNVLALLPMMNGLATHQTLTVTHNGVPQTLHDAAYALDQQRFDPKTPPVAVLILDQVGVTCSYVNNTGQTVTSGTTSTTEQCFTGLYRYPAPAQGSVFGCVTP